MHWKAIYESYVPRTQSLVAIRILKTWTFIINRCFSSYLLCAPRTAIPTSTLLGIKMAFTFTHRCESVWIRKKKWIKWHSTTICGDFIWSTIHLSDRALTKIYMEINAQISFVRVWTPFFSTINVCTQNGALIFKYSPINRHNLMKMTYASKWMDRLSSVCIWMKCVYMNY